MQSFAWYSRRLRSMSAPEVLWRCRSVLRQSLDRVAAPGRRRPPALDRIANVNGQRIAYRSQALRVPCTELPARFAENRRVLLAMADRICQNRLQIFDIADHNYGATIDWNYEPKAGVKTPLHFAGSIDYRDYDAVGDCKFVWEPNRHAHLVVLGRAYRVAGDRRYAEAVVDQITSWIQQCPFGYGMNWRSPLELAIRLINWVWATELVRPASVIDRAFEESLLACAYRHLWEITRNYSRFSSANNHRIGEAAGVLIGTAYLANIEDAPRWFDEARTILAEEIEKQTYADGANREQAIAYHLFVLEFFVLAGLAARRVGADFDRAYWARVEAMMAHLVKLQAGGDALPMYGDNDDGYVLDLGDRQRSDRGLLAVGAALFNRADFKQVAGAASETTFWLLGPEGLDAFDALTCDEAALSLSSTACADSGLYLLQCGSRTADGDDRISVTFDCGELGFGSIAAHGHADALNVTLRVSGHDVLIDPGTYDYFSHRAWRDYFRSTRAHNTVVVDGQDQSEPRGLFLWGRHATCRCLTWQPTADGGCVSGEHDGYTRLRTPVRHQRRVTLDGTGSEIRIEDRLEGKGNHTGQVCFHVAETCDVRPAGDHAFEIHAGDVTLVIELDPSVSVTLHHGSNDPIAGWVSRGYHRKSATTTLVETGKWQDRRTLTTTIRVRRFARVETEPAGVVTCGAVR